MNEPITKQQLLEKIRQSRAEWDSFLSRLDEDQLIKSGASGEWSVKGIIAHLTWHEREMIAVIQAHALAGSDLWNLPLDQRNRAIYLANKDRPLKEVQEEAHQVFQSLLQQIESLAEEDLHDPGCFPGMPLDWQPWDLLAGNTYEHYAAHLPQIQALIK